MALDFENKFTKPLSNDLMQGKFKGGEDFAKAIVEYYISTVKDGMPTGIPLTLPAPGLNPIAPPPFAISSSGIKKVNPTKEKAMFNILKAYFVARDMEVTKLAIEGLKGSVTQTMNRLNQKRKEVLDIADQIKKASVEVKNTPRYIEEIVEGVKELVLEEKAKVKNLKDVFVNLAKDPESLGIDKAVFEKTFSLELGLIDILNNFKVKSFDDFTKIPSQVESIKNTIDYIKRQSQAGSARRAEKRVETIDEELNTDNENVNAVKAYISNHLSEIVLSIEALADIALDLPSFLSYIEKLIKKSPKLRKLKKLYDSLSKLDNIKRIVEPGIELLRVKVDIKKNEIRNYIQPKIKDIKKKLEDKVLELTIKSDKSQKENLYLKVRDKVKEFKENHVESIKEKKQQIDLIGKIIKRTIKITSEVVVLEGSLVEEFKNIKDELLLIKEDASISVSKLKDKTKQAKKQLTDRAPKTPILETDSRNTDPTITPTVRIPGTANIIQGYDRAVNSPLDLVKTRELRKSLSKNQQSKIGPASDIVDDYMNEMGMGDLTSTVSEIIVSTKSDLQTFKHLFETKRNQLVFYQLTIEHIVREIEKLQIDLQVLYDSKGSVDDRVVKEPIRFPAIRLGISLMDLFRYINDNIKPIIKKIKTKADLLKKGIKKHIATKTEKIERDIKSYLLNLVPLKSYQTQAAADIEEKEKILDAKRRRVEDFKAKAKYYNRQAITAAKMISSSTDLLKTLVVKKDYRYASSELNITNIGKGFFDLQIQSGSELDQHNLKEEKKAFEKKMLKLKQVDIIVRAIGVILVGFTEKLVREDVASETKRFKTELKKTPNNTDSVLIKGIQVIEDLISAKVDDPIVMGKLIIELATDQSKMESIASAFHNLEVVTHFTQLETKHLQKARQFIATLVTNPISDDEEYIQRLGEIKDILNKRQSIIVMLIVKLRNIIDGIILTIKKDVDTFIDKQKKKIQVRLDKLKEEHREYLDKIKSRLVNTEAAFMSIALGLAARVFWTGITWRGSNQTTNHVAIGVGSFAKIKALPQDGLVSMVREIAHSFELQIKQMTGLVIPPPNTGITPIPFSSYI